MTTQHTPGKLKMQNPHAGERGFEIALEPGLEQVCQDVTEANARRLVACWNACEGLTTEHLENIDMLGETLAGRFADFHASERELMDTRDELLAALKELDAKPEHTSSWLKARAAIAKVISGHILEKPERVVWDSLEQRWIP